MRFKYCVGLTGDIASGKTTAAELFSKLGIDVIHADKLSRELTAKNQTAYKNIVDHYGTEILHKDGELDRNMLRDIIFSNPEERYWLEQLLHPLIRHELKKRVYSSHTPYCIAEIPLLITKQNYPYIDRILLINAPLDTQISRVMRRDQCTKEQAMAILSAQPDITLRLKNADDVIANNFGIKELTEDVNQLHHKYLEEINHLKLGRQL